MTPFIKDTVAFLKKSWLLCLFGVCMFVYIVIRAFTVSITHDEVNTCLLYAPMSVYDIVTYKDPIPNNHILHTLLVKLCENLFGISQFTVRIPNLLGFFLYFGAVVAFVYAVSPKWTIRIFALSAFMLNPFLIDFFSLARGYALSLDFMLVACYMAYLWLHEAKTAYLCLALGLAITAAYTNFTALNFFAPFAGLLAVSILQHARQHAPKDTHAQRLFWLKHGAILAAGCLFLAAISYLPIKAMTSTDQFRFWGTKGFFEDTLQTLVYMSLDGRGYIKNMETTKQIFSIFTALYLCVLYAAIAINLWTKKTQLIRNPLGFFGLLLFGAVASVIVQYFLLGTPYVTSRTALFFYPLTVLATIFFAEKLRQLMPKTELRLFVPTTLFIVWHFIGTLNLRSAGEWWYDRDDKIVLNYLKKVYEESGRKEPIKLDAHWLFLPALHFYEQTENMSWIKLASWHQDPRPNDGAEYYYVVSEELPAFTERYEPVMDFDWKSRILMRLKPNAEQSK